MRHNEMKMRGAAAYHVRDVKDISLFKVQLIWLMEIKAAFLGRSVAIQC